MQVGVHVCVALPEVALRRLGGKEASMMMMHGHGRLC